MRFSPRASRAICGLALALILPVLLAPLAAAKSAKPLDIADNVAANRILTKFSAMIQAADLGTFLSSKGPFTVFAPTDSAFARIPQQTLDSLLLPENKELLQRIVLYHVFSGKIYSAKDLVTVPTLVSAEGQSLTLKKGRYGTQLVQKAKIIHADIRCLNGIIHQIDTLLIPSDAPLSSVVGAPPPGSTPTTPSTNAPTATAPDTNAAPLAPPTVPAKSAD